MINLIKATVAHSKLRLYVAASFILLTFIPLTTSKTSKQGLSHPLYELLFSVFPYYNALAVNPGRYRTHHNLRRCPAYRIIYIAAGPLNFQWLCSVSSSRRRATARSAWCRSIYMSSKVARRTFTSAKYHHPLSYSVKLCRLLATLLA